MRPSAVASRPLELSRLGRVGYADALGIQAERVGARREGSIPDQLLLLEHDHVITIGTSGTEEHVLLAEAERRLLGVELFHSGRGGDVTYHGPGQLVGYPILDLKPDRCDLHRYVRDLEEALMRALSTLGLEPARREGLTGVWLGEEKVAAIGVRVSSGWITSHGFALNVSTDLSFFGSIVPCGIRRYGVTSIEKALGREPDPDVVEERVVSSFLEVFGLHLAEDGSPESARGG